MIHDNPLNKAIEICGLAPLAISIGVSYQAIQRYLKTRVASEKVISICQAVGWQVTPHELRPDIYPHPDDGMPHEMRGSHDESLGRRSNDRRHRNVIIKSHPENSDS